MYRLHVYMDETTGLNGAINRIFNKAFRVDIKKYSINSTNQRERANQLKLKGSRPLRVFRFGQEPLEVQQGEDVNFLME